MKRILFFLTVFAALSAVSRPAQAQPPQVPDHVVFAGERITFDRPDLYERMDRELITFTYMHTNSTLMLKRSGKYFPVIEPILKELGIPDDLKYLMVIESNLDPGIVSAAGAAGLWQFMRTTGREYGLEVNDNIDERFNIEKSTRAACRYLRDAYAKYGNWMTVAASYNAGQASISGRLDSQHRDTAMDLWLPSETDRYMFRILAAKMLFENPAAFGFNVPETSYYKYVPPRKIVTVTDTVDDLVKFAEDHGTSYAELKRANLWLRDSMLKDSSHRTYKVVIP